MRQCLWFRSALLVLGYLTSLGSLAAQAEVKFEVVTPGVLEVVSGQSNMLRTVTPATLKIHTDTPLQLRIEPPSLVSGASPEAADTRKRATVKFIGLTIKSLRPLSEKALRREDRAVGSEGNRILDRG